MKKKLFFIAAISLAITRFVMGDSVTGTLSVSGTLAVSCQIISVTPVDFGNFKPTTDGAIFPGSGEITVNCDDGTPYNIALNAGTHQNGASRFRMILFANSAFSYFLYKDQAWSDEWGDMGPSGGTYPYGTPLSATANGSNQPHTVYARLIAQGSGQPGVYTDSVVVTVNF